MVKMYWSAETSGEQFIKKNVKLHRGLSDHTELDRFVVFTLDNSEKDKIKD